jgi:uncharacterized membrane protein
MDIALFVHSYLIDIWIICTFLAIVNNTSRNTCIQNLYFDFFVCAILGFEVGLVLAGQALGHYHYHLSHDPNILGLSTLPVAFFFHPFCNRVALVRQALYHLSHALSPRVQSFCVDIRF